MFNKLKLAINVEIIFTMIVIIGGFFILKSKVDLTTHAKQDVILIKKYRTQILNNQLNLEQPLIIKNSFDGNIKILHNNKTVDIESNNLSYQSCFRYALDGEIFDTIYVNNKLLYRSGEVVSREKALNLCLLNPNKSVVTYSIKI